MELRCLLYMAACLASFPLYRRPGTWRSVAWLSTVTCIITSFAYVCLACVFIWNITLPNPPDKPEIRVARINGSLTGVKQAAALVFLSVIGIRKDGLHHFLITVKKIRNHGKPRHGKEPRLIINILNAYALLHIVMMGFASFFLFTGLLPTEFSSYYKSTFASFTHSEDNLKLYMFSKSPLEFFASSGAGLAILIFMTSVIIFRREINVFCENLENYAPQQITSSFLEEVCNDHEYLLLLMSVTSRIFSPYYSFSLAACLSSAAFLGFNAFYPIVDSMSLVYFMVVVLEMTVLTAVSIYANAGVSDFFYFSGFRIRIAKWYANIERANIMH